MEWIAADKSDKCNHWWILPLIAYHSLTSALVSVSPPSLDWGRRCWLCRLLWLLSVTPVLLLPLLVVSCRRDDSVRWKKMIRGHRGGCTSCAGRRSRRPPEGSHDAINVKTLVGPVPIFVREIRPHRHHLENEPRLMLVAPSEE